MSRGGRRLGALVAGLAASLVLWAPAADAAKPGLELRLVSKSQRTILKSGRIAVRARARKEPSLVRLFASFRRHGKKSAPVVATRVSEVTLGKRHARKVKLKLTKAGRRAIKGCKRGTIVVTGARLKRRGGKPGKRLRVGWGLKRDPKRCGKTPGAGGPGHGPGGSGGNGGGSGGGGSPPPVDYTPDNPERCDWIDWADCMLPFPNDHFTTADSTTATGRRLNLNVLSMPRNVENKPIDPGPFNRNDGFSPGSQIVTRVPGLDTKTAFDKSRIVPIDDMRQTYRVDQPVVLIDTQTLERQLIWAEVDANPKNPSNVNLLIRPGRNLAEGHRFIVALRRLNDAAGKPLVPVPGFSIYRDGNPTKSAAVEKRRSHFESIFRTLAEAGIGREDLYRAWDFTVASERNLSERMLHMRDDAFKQLGDTNLADLKVAGSAPKFTAHVEPSTDPDRIAYSVEGTYEVPCYLDAPGCPSGSEFAYDPTKTTGTPVRIPGNTTTARYTCLVPKVAVAEGGARPSLYGHGLLGSRGEVFQSQARAMVQEHNFVYCATDWIGMSCADLPDIPGGADDIQDQVEEIFGRFARGTGPNLPNCDYQTVVAMEHDLSNFPKLADRVQQGMLNFLYLARLMVHPQGFNSNAAFQRAGGQPIIDTTRAYYDGNSQGGIIGGSLMALFVDGDRGVLGVPGMNYSTLLQRSTDFGTGKSPDPSNPDLPEYSYVLYQSYPNELQRPLILSLMQLLWDRAEADGYALHMTDDPLPNTPPHHVMLHGGIGDHQVAQVAAETEARTIGARARFPYAAPGRDLDLGNPIFGVPPIGSFPFDGSAIVEWDIGAPRTIGTKKVGTPPPPNENVPPSRDYQDPHEYPRRQPEARQQKSAFLSPGGRVIDVCGLGPCLADPTL
ncbi:MAG TPA: hypothetical protein VJT75_10435 [Thermoleophilaceae bacterium]|nr:hypothetical protein [Thermoleophilaceae bacterium]